MTKKLILVRLQEIMYWIDCYIEEGTIFHEIEETGRINQFLYQEGLIKVETYHFIKHKLLRLLDELEEAFTRIYEEVHC